MAGPSYITGVGIQTFEDFQRFLRDHRWRPAPRPYRVPRYHPGAVPGTRKRALPRPFEMPRKSYTFPWGRPSVPSIEGKLLQAAVRQSMGPNIYIDAALLAWNLYRFWQYLPAEAPSAAWTDASGWIYSSSCATPPSHRPPVSHMPGRFGKKHSNLCGATPWQAYVGPPFFGQGGAVYTASGVGSVVDIMTYGHASGTDPVNHAATPGRPATVGPAYGYVGPVFGPSPMVEAGFGGAGAPNGPPGPPRWMTPNLGNPKLGPLMHELRPPRRGEKEKKTNPKGKLGPVLAAILNHGVGPLTEAGDLLDAFYGAIPVQYKKFGRVTPQDKLEAVYKGLHAISIPKLIEGIIVNGVGDYAVGKFGQALKQAIHNNPYYRSPVGLQAGGRFRPQYFGG